MLYNIGNKVLLLTRSLSLKNSHHLCDHFYRPFAVVECIRNTAFHLNLQGKGLDGIHDIFMSHFCALTLPMGCRVRHPLCYLMVNLSMKLLPLRATVYHMGNCSFLFYLLGMIPYMGMIPYTNSSLLGAHLI